jgi:putative transcriptional regulator
MTQGGAKVAETRQMLIELREKAKLSQEDIAYELGISRSFYGHIETGNRNPTYGLAKRIAKIVGGDVDTLFFDVESYRMKPERKRKAS